MKIERAELNGETIGHRITNGKDVVLIWEDDPVMDGIRIGPEFTPGIGQEVGYNELTFSELAEVSDMR